MRSRLQSGGRVRVGGVRGEKDALPAGAGRPCKCRTDVAASDGWQPSPARMRTPAVLGSSAAALLGSNACSAAHLKSTVMPCGLRPSSRCSSGGYSPAAGATGELAKAQCGERVQ